MTSSTGNPKHVTITEYAECPYCSYSEAITAGGTTFWCPACEHFFDESESENIQTIIEGIFLDPGALSDTISQLGVDVEIVYNEEEDDGTT